MAKKKIVFFINAVTVPRCIKRIEEFIDNGYEVEAYGFDRGGNVHTRPSKFDIKVIGYHNISQSYFERLRIIYKSMKPIIRQYKNQDVLFYYFFYDVAFVGWLLSKKLFIYEESDIPYTGIGNVVLRKLFGRIDRKIISRSLLTVMTSEGFIDFHFGDLRPKNIVVIPNRVSSNIVEFEYYNKSIDINHLKFAFVGSYRYESVLNFTAVIAENYPQHQFHIFGLVVENKNELDQLLQKFSNIHFHGTFKNPDDLPKIYEQINLVLSTYDATSINAQYAEPNKLYESIYFRTPIIVSSNTFLAKKVNRLGIGYDINGLDKEEIKSFVRNLTLEDLMNKQKACESIPKETAINKNVDLFNYLSTCNGE